MISPRVSITIPSYNHALFLPETIDSVLNQSFQDFELIIVDDGSTDNSLEIAEAYAARSARIRVLTHPRHANRGISATSNLALDHIQGEYWTGVPSDDVLYPWRLETQVDFLDAHPDLAWCYGYADYIDAEGVLLTEMGKFIGIDISQAEDPLEALLLCNKIPGMTVLARRDVIDSLRLRHREELIYSDWEFWLRLTAHHTPGYLGDRPLMKYRVHSTNTSLGVDPTENVLRGLLVLQAIAAHRNEIGGGFRKKRVGLLLQLQITEHNYRLGRLEDALTALKEAFREDPNADADYLLDWLAPWAYTKFEEWFVSHLPNVTKRAGPILRYKIKRARRRIEKECQNELYALYCLTPRWHPRRILTALNYRLRNHRPRV